MSNGLGSKATRNEPLPILSNRKLRNQKLKTKPLNMKNKSIHESKKMKMKTLHEMTFANGISLPSTLLCSAALALACVAAGAKQNHYNDYYRAINLVSHIADVGQ